MKKIFLLLLFGASITLNSQTNLVTNPSFEEWDSFDSNPNDWGRWLNALWYKSSDASEGNTSVELETSCNTGCSLKFNFIYNNDINLEAGKTYVISVDYKVSEGTFNKLSLQVWRSIFDIESVETTDIDNSGAWKTYSFEYTPSSNETIDFHLNAYSDNENEKILIDNVKIIDASVLSTNKLNLVNTTIAPNPIENNLSVNFGTDFSENFSLKIYSVTGRLVKENKKMNPTNNINLSNLQSGVYFLQISDKEKFYNKKIIKN